MTTKPTTRTTAITNDSGALPAELATAINKSEQVIERHARLYQVLRDTHASIPKALADERRLTGELGAAEVAGGHVESLRARVAEVESQRESDVRRRSAAANSILAMEGELIAVRAALIQSRERFAVDVAKDFQSRYAVKIAELQALWQEAAALSEALRTPVPAPPPVRPLAASARANAPALPIPPAVGRIGAVLDRLDAGAALCAGIRQTDERDRLHQRLAENRTGMAGEVVGVFVVTKPFTCPLDSLEFKPDELVDSTLLGSANLRRALTSRFLRLVSETSASVAAA